MGSTAQYIDPASSGEPPKLNSGESMPNADSRVEPSPQASPQTSPQPSPQPSSQPSAPPSGSVGSPADVSTDEPTVISKPGQAGSGAHAPDAAGGNTIVPASSNELKKLLAGEKLGHYQLLEFAGGGGMGTVFRARDLTLNREVAIKVLSRDQAGDEETLKRFKNEAQSAARLDHENIARVHYVGEDRGLHYIVFEFIEGVNIRQLVERRSVLPLDEAISYTLQIADALAHASTRDVVHRDIKPSNILITAQGKAKLVDMGLARLHGFQAPSTDLTASGVTLGTFDYISPEQARDPRSADVRSDIYSLGCTLYYMLTSRPPFPEGTVLQKLLQHNSDDPIDPREYNPGLPDAVTTILRKMLAKDPQRRYQTPGELIGDLLHLAERLGIQRAEVRLATKWDGESREPPAWQRHLPWLVPLGLLAAVIVGLELYDRRAEKQWNAALQQDFGLAAARKSETPEASGDAAGAAAGGTTTEPEATTTAVADPATVPAPTATPTPTATPDATPTPTAVDPAPAGSRKLPEPREGVLVVCDTPDDEGRFTSLRAACFAAKNGDVVELCYDGERVERPLALNNLKITVRAGEGYRPAVRFRPAEAAIPNLPHAMISVVGGRMTFVKLEIGFDVPSPQELPADEWSLFSLQQSEYLGLEQCILTVRNAGSDGATYHQNVAVIAMSQPPGSSALLNMRMPNDAAPADERPPAVDVRLEHCIVRGEASLLRVDELQPVAMSWQNGLLAVSESALLVSGGQSQTQEAEVQFDLSHVTAVVGKGLIRMSDGFETPYLPDVAVVCADSIILSTSGAPLVDYDGIDVRNDFLSSFQWTGERVFYEGFQSDNFWRIASADDVMQMLSYDDWRAQWGPQRELQAAVGEVRWQKTIAGRPVFHAARPDDFGLDESLPSQRAVGGAADGGNVGMSTAELPKPATTVVAEADDASVRAASGVR